MINRRKVFREQKLPANIIEQAIADFKNLFAPDTKFYSKCSVDLELDNGDKKNKNFSEWGQFSEYLTEYSSKNCIASETFFMVSSANPATPSISISYGFDTSINIQLTSQNDLD